MPHVIYNYDRFNELLFKAEKSLTSKEERELRKYNKILNAFFWVNRSIFLDLLNRYNEGEIDGSDFSFKFRELMFEQLKKFLNHTDSENNKDFRIPIMTYYANDPSGFLHFLWKVDKICNLYLELVLLVPLSFEEGIIVDSQFRKEINSRYLKMQRFLINFRYLKNPTVQSEYFLLEKTFNFRDFDSNFDLTKPNLIDGKFDFFSSKTLRLRGPKQ